MRRPKLVILITALAALLTMQGYGAPTSTLRLDFSNPSLYPSQWTLVIHPDGTGHFHAEGGAKPSYDEAEMLPGKVDRDVNLSDSFAVRAFHIARDKRLLGGKCESHLKVAFQGWKKITYSGPEGEGGCEFNYSKDKDIQELGDSLVAVASTLIEGARLEMLLQHDPLGLDKAVEYIAEAADDGRLQQICTIKDILERLENDPHVMERVRKRARTLLARADN
jgi:hypothetical protein